MVAPHAVFVHHERGSAVAGIKQAPVEVIEHIAPLAVALHGVPVKADVARVLVPDEHFKEKIMREINSIPKEDDIIIMTDMFGGSVNNELLELCKIKNCHLVTGMNLLLVIGLCLGSEEEPIDEQIHRLVEEAKTGIIYCNELNSDSEFENEEF